MPHVDHPRKQHVCLFQPHHNARLRTGIRPIHNNMNHLESGLYLSSSRQTETTKPSSPFTRIVRGVFEIVFFIPKTILWQCHRFITWIQRAIFRAMVSATAAFCTAVMIDPAVNRAFARAMTDGINLWFTQPTIKVKLLALQRNLSEQEPSLAKPIGEDFPKVIFNFIVGLILQGFDEQAEENDETDTLSDSQTDD